MEQAKQWLKKCWELQSRIAYLSEIINDPSIYQSPGFSERINTGSMNSEELKINALILNIEQAVKDRDKRLMELSKRQIAINQLSDADEKTILLLRYLKRYKWKDVEKWMMDHDRIYDIRTIYRLHDKALKNIKICQ